MGTLARGAQGDVLVPSHIGDLDMARVREAEKVIEVDEVTYGRVILDEAGRIVPEKVVLDYKANAKADAEKRRKERTRQALSRSLGGPPGQDHTVLTPEEMLAQQTDEAAEMDREARRERRKQRREEKAARMAADATAGSLSTSALDTTTATEGGATFGDEEEYDSEGEGPLPNIPGAPIGRERGMKHGGDLAPLSRVGTDGVQINPRRRARGAKVEREIVKMRNENQR